jgi:hypothetical protein
MTDYEVTYQLSPTGPVVYGIILVAIAAFVAWWWFSRRKNSD